MPLSDHYRGGQTERMVVTIVTVDPASEKIEGIGRDGAVIQISAGHASGFFRMPIEREQWVVVRENGIWQLESVIEDGEWTKKKNDLQMGEGLFTGTNLYNSTGQRFALANEIPPPGGGDNVGVFEQTNEPLTAQVGDIWIDTDASPEVTTDFRQGQGAFIANISVGASGGTYGAAWTKVPFDTESFDPDSWYDATNRRYTPQVPGLYEVGAMVPFTGGNGITATMSLALNAAVGQDGHDVSQALSPAAMPQATKYVVMNGTTDFLEVWCYVTVNMTLSSGGRFYGRLVRRT